MNKRYKNIAVYKEDHELFRLLCQRYNIGMAPMFHRFLEYMDIQLPTKKLNLKNQDFTQFIESIKDEN